MDLTQEALKMAGALALVVMILLGGLAWIRRTFGETPGVGGEPLMRILGGLRIGTGKQIMLVDVAGEILVLGTTAREMTLLTKVTDPDRTNRVRMLANPVVGRLGTWMAHWTQARTENPEDQSVAPSPSIRSTKCS